MVLADLKMIRILLISVRRLMLFMALLFVLFLFIFTLLGYMFYFTAQALRWQSGNTLASLL